MSAFGQEQTLGTMLSLMHNRGYLYIMTEREWTRVGDDEVLTFGTRTFWFERNGARYSLHIDQNQQNWITLRVGTDEDQWTLDLKQKKGEHIRLSGLAYWGYEMLEPGWVPHVDQGPGDASWYELEIGDRVVLTFYGNQEILRTDVALASASG